MIQGFLFFSAPPFFNIQYQNDKKSQRVKQSLFEMKDFMKQKLWLAPWYFLIALLNRGGPVKQITMYIIFAVSILTDMSTAGSTTGCGER